MSGLLSVKFEGFEQLQAALIELGNAVEIKKAETDALVEAAEPMAKAMRALAPPGIAETIEVSTHLSRRQKRVADRDPDAAHVYVGPKPTGPAILVEFGTVNRHWQTGKSTGHMTAKPFARPGFEQEKMPTIERFSKLLWIAIEKATKRIASKQAGASKR